MNDQQKPAPASTTEDAAGADERSDAQAPGDPAQGKASDESLAVSSGNGNGAAGDDEALPLEERLAEAERRAEEFREDMLRAHAERENMRKRTERDIARIRKYAIEAFATELLEIKDNLERSLSGGEDADDNVLEGVRLTLKSLERVFERFGIEEVPAAGQPFDPERHQAMSTLKTAEHAPNTVVEVVQKGYLLSDRLLRPAMVVVAAASEASGEKPRDEAAAEPEDQS